MSTRAAAGKWIPGLYADTPVVVAARRVLKRRLRALLRLLPLAAEQADRDVEHVHQLRVATRRAAAALRLFRPWCRRTDADALRRALRRIRRAASTARRADVQLAMLNRETAAGASAEAAGVERLRVAIATERSEAQKSVRRAASRRRREALAALRRRLVSGLRTRPARRDDRNGEDRATPYTLADLAACELPRLARSLRSAGAQRLRDLESLHALRIAGKKLRYALEALAGALPEPLRETAYSRVEEMQARLGAINDDHEMVQTIESLVRAPAPRDPADAGLLALCARFRAQRDRRRAEFIAWWSDERTRSCLGELDAFAAGAQRSPAGHVRASRRARATDAGNGHVQRRVAAIDVGTNSIRLVVADSDPLARFRVIEDVRETTRLGGGLYNTGRLDPSAVERSLTVLERMKAVADHHHVDRLRAVGTSALREAANAGEFVALARRRAGVDVEIIDAEHEARLAFSSVANAFDLGELRCAAVDLGGGSTELVLSSAGLIDAIYTLPLGAVRLTDRFADDGETGGYRFAAMRRAIDRTIAAVVGDVPQPPELMIGTGGTFTSLAKVAIRRGGTGVGEGRFPFAVRGYELRDGEVFALLDWLRHMPLEQRRRVPGIGEGRAEILVAGLCIVERLMENLCVERLRIHDGGIRDGLLSEMLDELAAAPARSADGQRATLAAVRAFAQRCRYDRAHSEHVTRLALRIFDQLAEQIPDAAAAWAHAPARDVLQAAGLLHDVGILIEYRRHHRHSFEMIEHAGLPLSRRLRTLVACVARYHRRRGPRPGDRGFRRLGADDQRLVSHVAGVLRIADGLDRLHTQNVVDVLVRAEPGCVAFDVLADDEPGMNLRHARRKSDVFRAAFHADARFTWTPATPGGAVVPAPGVGRTAKAGS